MEMRRCCVILSGLLALSLGALPVDAQQSAAHAAAAAPDTILRGEAANIGAAIRELFAAAEKGDLDRLGQLYAGDSLTVVEGAGINRGWTDYRDHHLAPEMKEMKNFRYRPFEIQARAEGNLGWAIFRYALTADLTDRKIDIVGRGTAILEKKGGRWIIRHTQTSGRARRPTDPAMPGAGTD
jgi:ketosteroid isomerase-like protein